jgi:hypothetical protein
MKDANDDSIIVSKKLAEVANLFPTQPFVIYMKEAEAQHWEELYNACCDEFEIIKEIGKNRTRLVRKNKDIFIRTYKLQMTLEMAYTYTLNIETEYHEKFKEMLVNSIYPFLRPYMMCEYQPK